jgi:uridine kinase
MRTNDLLSAAIAKITQKRNRQSANRALWVAISGIDASGKGYLIDRLALRLREDGICAQAIHADGWLNLPHMRFSLDNPAEHFTSRRFASTKCSRS